MAPRLPVQGLADRYLLPSIPPRWTAGEGPGQAGASTVGLTRHPEEQVDLPVPVYGTALAVPVPPSSPVRGVLRRTREDDVFSQMQNQSKDLLAKVNVCARNQRKLPLRPAIGPWKGSFMTSNPARIVALARGRRRPCRGLGEPVPSSSRGATSAVSSTRISPRLSLTAEGAVLKQLIDVPPGSPIWPTEARRLVRSPPAGPPGLHTATTPRLTTIHARTRTARWGGELVIARTTLSPTSTSPSATDDRPACGYAPS